MKTNLYIIFILLLSFTTTALIAGNDNTVATVDRCERLFVTVTGEYTIDDGEYDLPLCTEVNDDYWFCECYNNYDLNVTLDYRTMNAYIFDLEIFYEDTVDTTTRRGSTRYIVINETEDKDPIVETVIETVVEEVVVTEIEYVNVTNNKTNNETPIADVGAIKTPLWLWFLGLLFLIIIAIGFVIYYLFKDRPLDPPDEEEFGGRR